MKRRTRGMRRTREQSKPASSFVASARRCGLKTLRRIDMRISIMAREEGVDADEGKTFPIGVIHRDPAADPACGMGLWIQEAHAPLESLQALPLDEQAAEFIRITACCLACSAPLGVKDNKLIVYCTAYGKKSIRSPWFYSCCSRCGFQSSEHGRVSPLAHALRDRVHPLVPTRCFKCAAQCSTARTSPTSSAGTHQERVCQGCGSHWRPRRRCPWSWPLPCAD
jgi:hypothetical protein